MPIGNIGSILEVSSTERCAPPLSWRSSLNHRIHPRLYSNLQLQHSATIDPAKRSDARMNMHSAIADKRIGDYSKNKAPRCHLQCQERATVSSSSVASYRTPTVLSVLHSREYQSRASTRNKRNKENTGRQANRLIPNQSPSEAIQRLKHQSSAMDKAV
ncbi:hypothetical protein PRIPAC_91206 [Pristionchus pacificus]|uniref:Uncharacterized protein n=1 Tax=Pristionchus pacificus TaxID=54126 RepID=A0A2A6CZM5_PRIPA|nr:hypothetical protein PRIPAC_91206 [Pristionchus pacificus]|eukprot:PDM83481.1 hypothetical protein PRIPAC_35113 [Pristionchus pacificus]